MAILPAPRRNAMHAVYAFCRVVDDIADGPWGAEEKTGALSSWRAEIETLYAGGPASDSITAALSSAVAAFALPKEEFLLLIDGMQTDAEGPVVAPDREALALYTRQVAGTVGLLSIRIFGAYRGEVSERFALALGDALQLTNILRDVEEDAAIGRLYLPRELLAEWGLAGAAPMEVAGSPHLPAIRRQLGREAKDNYDEARRLAGEHDRRALRPALMMMGAYEGYWQVMARRRWDFAGKDKLQSGRQKLLRGLRYALLGPGAPLEVAS
jgi:phytoene synthase